MANDSKADTARQDGKNYERSAQSDPTGLGHFIGQMISPDYKGEPGDKDYEQHFKEGQRKA